MKYVVEVDGERHEVELDGSSAVIGGQRYEVSLDEVPGTPIRLLHVNGRTLRVVARRAEGRGRYQLEVGGWRHDGDALDQRTRAIRDLTSAAGVAAGPAPLVAPMPGLVVRLSVEVGDEVSAGQALVVMEAMKMENELRTRSAGTVTRVLVQVGLAVEKGAVLVELE